jgi:DNA-directed RNA polymerase subunit beta'
MRYVTSAKGEKIVITRSGEVLITDDNGREREKHKVPYGSTLQVADGQQVKAGTKLAVWDPHTRPIIAEYAGQVKFENVEEGVTVAKQIDEVTGLSTLVVIDPKRGGKGQTKGLRPQVKLYDADGQEVRMHGSDHAVTITFQVGAIITVLDGQQISVGDVLARLPQESAKTRDITGGLAARGRTCSKRVLRKMRACWPSSPVPFPSARIRKASSVWSSQTSKAQLTNT